MTCPFSEVRILVHKVVEVSYLPVPGCLVEGRQDVKELAPGKVCLKTNNVFHVLLVLVTKKDLRVVLVLHEKLHGRVDESSHGDAVGLSADAIE